MIQRSYFHRGGEVPLTGATIPGHFAAVARAHAGREAVVALPQRRRLSYAQLAVAVDRVAAGLLALGFGRGDRVGIWATNHVEWLLVQLATARIGALLVNVNPAYRARELEHALRKSAVQGLVLIPGLRGNDYLGTLRELFPELERTPPDGLRCAALPELRRVIVFDPADPERTPRPAAGFTTWDELLQAGCAVDAARLDAVSAQLDCDDPINIQYTSGTTGFPKAVVLTHHNILNNALGAARAMHFTADDRLCVPVPFYHCFGMVLSNLLCLSVGACLVIPAEHFDAARVLHAVADERCTALHGVPTMFIAELEQPDFDQLDLRSLRTGIMAGAPCPPELLRRVMQQMHCREILIGYGQTEASPLTHLTTREDSLAHRLETVGTSLPQQEVKVVSGEDGSTLPLGATGEICFRGYHVMRGYYGDPAATAAAIDAAGWLHSGDLGVMEPGGYLRITGRLKEMIIRGGENIYPREIEDLLFTHPKIAEAAVFGVPDPRYGEAVAAWIQLHEGQELTADEVREFCRTHLAHFKVPAIVRFVDAFPMTVTGKLQKFRMRELEAREASAD
ncbi:MAG TPA: fatty acid CoA ligase family protein [Gammaproteobacteria bacterium]